MPVSGCLEFGKPVLFGELDFQEARYLFCNAFQMLQRICPVLSRITAPGASKAALHHARSAQIYCGQSALGARVTNSIMAILKTEVTGGELFSLVRSSGQSLMLSTGLVGLPSSVRGRGPIGDDGFEVMRPP